MNQFQTWYRMLPAALRALLTINVVVYVAWQLLAAFQVESIQALVVTFLTLHPELPGILYMPWQIITYNFLHLGLGFGGLLHILFNMLWLVWIGREFEEMHGSGRMMGLYLVGGIGGGVMTVLLHAIIPTVGAFGGGAIGVYGASASVLGLMMAVGTMYPYKSVALFLIGVVRLVWVVIGFLVLDLLLIAGGGTSVSAHMGGALFGFLFAKVHQAGYDPGAWGSIFFRSRRTSRTTSSRGSKLRREPALTRVETWGEERRSGKPSQSTGRGAATGTTENEIDRILDKISEKGFEALTDEEKRTLYEASRGK